MTGKCIGRPILPFAYLFITSAVILRLILVISTNLSLTLPFIIIGVNGNVCLVPKGVFNSLMFCSRFVAKYLSHLLSSSAAVDRIVADDLQWLVIQTWLRCLISLTEKNQIVSEISR